MSWQNTIGSQQDYVYMRDILLTKKIAQHGGIKNTIQEQGSTETVYQMNDGTEIQFRFKDLNGDNVLNGDEKVKLDIIDAQSGKKLESYNTGDKLNDSLFDQTFADGKMLYQKGIHQID
jgi:hypothetical protein